MKLPHGDRAHIDVSGKLIGYCLNKLHPTGKHKARVFQSVLGINAINAQLLAAALHNAARDSQATVKERSTDATKYEVKFDFTGPGGTAVVKSGWVIETGSEIPRLTSCYVKRNKRMA